MQKTTVVLVRRSRAILFSFFLLVLFIIYLPRVFVIIMACTAIAWVPVVKETVFIYIQEITNYLAPPIACVFLIAILWKGCNEKVTFNDRWERPSRLLYDINPTLSN